MGKTPLDIHPDPCPNLLVEMGPQQRGVGSWVPKQKHTLLADYIGAARGAMQKWENRVFIDPFCGPGRVQVEGESITRDGGSLVAWHRSVWGKTPFSHMFVGDLDGNRSAACAARLRASGANATAFTGPAGETVIEMVKAVPQRSLCLAYIDPYNLEFLSMSIIETLAQLKNVDFAVHFSIMDLHRNVDFELDPCRARFDDAAPGWRNALKHCSKSALPGEFFQYWCKQVEELGLGISTAMPLVYNNTGHPIYRLVFFARHGLPHKLWGDVAKSKNQELDLF